MSSGIVIDSYVVGFLTALVVVLVLFAVARIGDFIKFQTGFTADVQRMDTQEFIGIVELPFVPTLLEIDGRLWFVHGTKSDGENTVLYVRLQDQ